MADNQVTISYYNDLITDGNGDTANLNGSVTVDYDNNSFSGSYQVKNSFMDSSGDFYGTLSESDGTYTIRTSERFSLIYEGQTPTTARAIYVANSSDTYDTNFNPNGQQAQPVSSSRVESDDASVCFASGALILTTRGNVSVEALKVGDIAVTASGGRRPIRWIGHRIVDCAAAVAPADCWPVRVLAGAFGGNLPERELRLSPGHPVLVGADDNNDGGHLVPIMCLINGTSIARAPVESVTYWHVELDEHDILLAEGLPAESFLDYGNRPWFGPAAKAHALANPDHIVPGLGARCRPVAIDGAVVEAERRRLDALFAMSLHAHCAWPETDSWLTV